MSDNNAICGICGDVVTLQGDDEDSNVVCPPCYRANLLGGFPFEAPTIARLADIPAVRRRELHLLDAARWPLTQGGEG